MSENETIATESAPKRIPYALTGVVIAWMVILAGAALFIFRPGERAKAGPAGAVEAPARTDMMVRYLVGADRLTRQYQKEEAAKVREKGLEAMPRREGHPEDVLRIEMLSAYLKNEWPSEEKLAELETENASMARDVKALRAIRQKTISPEESEWLVGRHGFAARLALAQTMPQDSAGAKAVVDDAMRTLFAVVGWMLVIIAIAIAGVVLFILWAVKWRKVMQPAQFTGVPRGQGGVYLEGFALFFVGMIAGPMLLLRETRNTDLWWIPLLIVIGGVVLAYYWPRIRGVDMKEVRRATGWHAGKGFWTEAGRGVLAWIAVTPLLGVAAVTMVKLAELMGVEISHPVDQQLAGDSALRWKAVALLVLWAPLTEELMFRGRLFPGMSARLPWWGAALASSVLFAAIHPQGLLFVPVLGLLAFLFAYMRRWRGSLVAPMTAHALNNGIIAMLMLTAM